MDKQLPTLNTGLPAGDKSSFGSCNEKKGNGCCKRLYFIW